MHAGATDESGLSSVAQALSKAISELSADKDKRVYAVMDGSQFDDLLRLLKQADVAHRRLYRYAGGDYSVILCGPWLVDPYQASVSSTSFEPIPDVNDDNASDDQLAQHRHCCHVIPVCSESSRLSKR
ncbi:hypothetical protein [Rhizobium sp. Leaf262]|uniref:hypothetical protein n=1 Tax=Rhizobium sp. Leaf262 TaxID=1736312 RepID=UPI0012E7E7C0|nr:hypothetical protein [Rhizobium sp. Leaf262]